MTNRLTPAETANFRAAADKLAQEERAERFAAEGRREIGAGRKTKETSMAADTADAIIDGPPKTDPAIWTMRPTFGVAGGPLEVVLTDEGNARAFSVGAQIRRGAPTAALEALHLAGGNGHLSRRGDGARTQRTDLGRHDQIAWGYLRARGLVESFQDGDGDGVRLTDDGRRAVARGLEERDYALDRCRLVAAFTQESR